MTDNNTFTRDIAAMIGSRICHDLISPVGAISNGVELLAMSGVGSGPELSLISESVDNANARVKFFRVAFGASSEGQMTARNEMADILKASGTERLKYIWDPMVDLPRAEVKLACLMILCMETALPRGGEIRATFEDGRWTVTGRAERLNPSPELWARLGAVSGTEDLTPAQVQFILAPMQAESVGRKITHSQAEGLLTLTA